MSNQNQKVNNQQNVTEQGQQQVQEVQPAPAVQQQTQQTPPPQQQAEPEKGGFGQWFKKHWKGIAGSAAAVLAAGGSAVVAYRKGKAANAACQPAQQGEDYTLDPNRE